MTFKNVCLLVIGATGVSTISYQIARAQAQQGKPRIAFTRVEVEKTWTAGESPTTLRTVVKALRSDGAHAESVLGNDGQHYGRNVTLPNERRTIAIDDTLRATTSWYISEQTAASLRRYSGDANCNNPLMSKIGEDTVLGYRAYKYVNTDHSGGETLTATHWFAPDLECVALYESLDWESNGKTGKTTHEVTTLTLGNPDQNLFVIPSGYTEMSPSQVANARAASRGRALPPGVLEHSLLQDRRYWESQKNKP